MILKCIRGWRDYFTARQLCPFDMLNDFEADWEQYVICLWFDGC